MNIDTLISKMNEYNINAYIIPTSDYHGSEYICDHFKARQILSGFTGSAGTLVICNAKAYLWTDGRYFIQAEAQLKDSGIELKKMGMPGVDTIEAFLNKNLDDSDTIGVDGRLVSISFVENLRKNITKNVNFMSNKDLLSELWIGRPPLPIDLVNEVSEDLSGESTLNKLTRVREIMRKNNTDTYIITSLEEQAWLFNLRGEDILQSRLFLSYTIITETEAILFIDLNKLTDLTIEVLKESNVTTLEYNDFYTYLQSLENKTIYLDPKKTNYQVLSSVESKNKLFYSPDIIFSLKCIKNETEVKMTKNAHILDGIAMVKIMKYIDDCLQHNIKLTEISVSDKLEEYRREQDACIGLSFNTICAFNENAAMMHYSATKETNKEIKDSGLLLIDSGGQYHQGTTDITRTYVIGEVSQEIKLHYTAVLKGMINLSKSIFLSGCNGQNLDILARGPIWNLLLDYKCGTGHGVGHCLGVHEGPNGFRWQIVPERNDSAKLEPNMITTIEPGIYLENKYGIRIENELLCINKGETEFGSFLGFETITFAPIDTRAIDKTLLNKDEIDWLNNYHKAVYDKLSRFFKKDDLAFLKRVTKEI